MNFFATSYPKNMINILFDNQSVVAFKKMFIKIFGNVIREIWIFEVDAFKAIKHREIRNFTELYWISLRFQFRNAIFSDGIFCNHLPKKYDKYIIRQTNSNGLQQSVCLKFWKHIVSKKKKEFDAFKSIENHEIWNSYRILSNFDRFSNKEPIIWIIEQTIKLH